MSTGYRSTGLRVLDQWFWIDDPELEEKFLVAKLVSYDASGAKFEKMDGSTFNLRTAEMAAFLESAEECIHSEEHDLMQLIHFNERQILHHLRKRFRDGVYYTEIGDILISFNPQKALENKPRESTMEGPYGKAQRKKYQKMTADNASTFEPHIFKFAQESYLKLLSSKQSQSLVLSGESGAGQTFNQHQALEYLLKTIPSAMESKSSGKMILTAISILECFGNAATERNPNASQFGIWIDLEIETKTEQMVGCGFKEYLLATHRLQEFPMKSPKERSFDILELIRNQVHGADDSRYLPPPNEETAAAIPMTFEELKENFSALGCTTKDVARIVDILKAVIHIGRLDVEKGKFSKNDLEILAKIFELLGIEGDDRKSFKKIVTESKLQITSSDIEIPAKRESALEMLDKTARFLYLCLFRYLFLNFSFIFKRDKSIRASKVSSIGICNFPGFEVKESGNDLRELMENWVAEQLEELYLRDIFNDELSTLEENDMTVRNLMSKAEMQQTMEASWEVLKLLSKPQSGMLPIIERHTQQWRSMDSDDDTLLRDLTKSSKWSDYYQPHGHNGFIISHFGGETQYDITDFIVQNDDSFPSKMAELLVNSAENQVLGEAAKLHVESAQGHALDMENMTVIESFGKELEDLVSRVKQSDPHFIRCFRISNDDSGHFDSKLVYKQMASAGIQHVIKVRDLGLPFRFSMEKFVGRYIWLHPETKKRSLVASHIAGWKWNPEEKQDIDWEQMTEDILETFWRESGAAGDVRLQSGKTHVFMTEEMYSALDEMRDEFLKTILATVVRFIKATTAVKLCHKLTLFLKILKMGLRNGNTVRMIEILEKIKNLECEMDLKDAILEHHIVREAAEMSEYNMPRGMHEVRDSYVPDASYRRPSIYAPRVPRSVPVTAEDHDIYDSNPRRGSASKMESMLRSDSHRASIIRLEEKLEDIVEESATKMAAMQFEYQLKIDELNTKLEESNAKMVEMEKGAPSYRPTKAEFSPLDAETQEEMHVLQSKLDEYMPNVDELSDTGLSCCTAFDTAPEELFGPNDGMKVEPAEAASDPENPEDAEDAKQEEEPQCDLCDDDHAPESKFIKLASAVQSQLSDAFVAVRIAQDLIRQKETLEKECEKQRMTQENERENAVEGLDEIHRGLDELNLAMNSWSGLGEIRPELKSALQMDCEATVPFPMQVHNKMLLDSMLYQGSSLPWMRPIHMNTAEKQPVEIAKSENGQGPVIHKAVSNVSVKPMSKRVNDTSISMGNNPLDGFDYMGANDDNQDIGGISGGTPTLSTHDTKGLISRLSAKYSIPVQSSISPKSETSRGHDSSKCMLLQDVAVIRDPSEALPVHLGEIKATTIIKVESVEEFGDKKYAHISSPEMGWIPCRDEFGNPNVPSHYCDVTDNNSDRGIASETRVSDPGDWLRDKASMF